MIKSIAFRTQARTVDHLGREQIADCPTAISELWKNAYDAYARSVELNIFDGPSPIAAIYDDGHGMNYEEFIDRWLVIGTQSKFKDNPASVEDRNGVPRRPTQGQKGIGRLSCANLGPLMLLISKRRQNDFVAALLDWRIFENPYLLLSDILVPVIEFSDRSELLKQLPAMFDQLMENIWGGKDDKERRGRIESAWLALDKTFLDDEIDKRGMMQPPSESIAKTVIDSCFEDKHLDQWAVWNGKSKHGTALFISDINYDLRIHLAGAPKDSASKKAKDRFFETLSSFVDPFYDPANPEITAKDPHFDYSVRVWDGEQSHLVLASHKEFNRHMTNQLEHVLDGYIDTKGVFHGQVKAYGEWRKEGRDYVIEPPDDVPIPIRRDTSVGPADIYIATFEQLISNTTHSEEEFRRYNDLTDKYAGFMIFRDGLRVLPYGREDNDFFEIETRRSKSAGREYWNKRRMFGRLALSREKNPNLKDKAGREGFIDNIAAKTLRLLVENILMQSARDYFGSDSDLRQQLLPDIREANRKEKARIQRNELRKKNRRKFRKRLKKHLAVLPLYVDRLESVMTGIDIQTVADIEKMQSLLDKAREDFSELNLPGAPHDLGTLEEEYLSYRQLIRLCSDLLEEISRKIDAAVQRVNPSKPSELLKKQLQRNAGQIHNRIRKWKSRIVTLQKDEHQRIKDLIEKRNKLFHSEVAPLLERVEQDRMSLIEASALMEISRKTMDHENEEVFESYIGALEALQESIDLEALASFGSDEIDELHAEVGRLNALAQLGITVEILGHELQAYDDMIAHGINTLPEDVQKSEAVHDIRLGYDGLTDQLRFLSPLKLSGQKVQRWISGKEIYDYIEEFFRILFKRNGISFTVTDAFISFRVFDQPSRLFPVFINLVNNSQYWLTASETKNPQIQLDLISEKVVIGDNGPGVDETDVSRLFSLFFTKKLRGGRGVGLYLSKVNLAAGGHRIGYADEDDLRILSGANFVIEFRGAEYDGKQ